MIWTNKGRERERERESGKCVLAVRLDDDDFAQGLTATNKSRV